MRSVKIALSFCSGMLAVFFGFIAGYGYGTKRELLLLLIPATILTLVSIALVIPEATQ